MTLIELLIALAIAGILIAAVYKTFISHEKTYQVQGEVVDMQQNVRALTNRMMREIRMAGFGNVSMLLPAPYGSGPGITIGAKTYNDVVNPNYPAAGALSFVAGMGSTTLTATPATNQITVSSLTDSQGNTLFDTQNLKYISIGGVESNTITAINGTTLTLSSNLIYSYPVNTPVFGIRAISYQVVNGSLLRNDNSGAVGQPQTLADNIDALQFVYLDGNGNSTANPPDIRVVQLTLRAKTNDSDPDYKSAGGYRKRTIASNIHLRNMGLGL